MSTDTPLEGWPAQPELTAREVFLELIREDARTLTIVAELLEKPATSRRREELRRRLSGVIAHCETLRLALDTGRGV